MAVSCCGAAEGASPRLDEPGLPVNQAWDIPNLFVPDGASFVSNSTVGPALTIMALSARAAAFIAEAHASGQLAKPTQQVSY